MSFNLALSQSLNTSYFRNVSCDHVTPDPVPRKPFVFSHWARRRGCFIHGVSDDMRMGTVVGFHCTDIVAARKLSSG